MRRYRMKAGRRGGGRGLRRRQNRRAVGQSWGNAAGVRTTLSVPCTPHPHTLCSYMLTYLHGGATGRLLCYNPADGSTTQLCNGIWFAKCDQPLPLPCATCTAAPAHVFASACAPRLRVLPPPPRPSLRRCFAHSALLPAAARSRLTAASWLFARRPACACGATGSRDPRWVGGRVAGEQARQQARHAGLGGRVAGEQARQQARHAGLQAGRCTRGARLRPDGSSPPPCLLVLCRARSLTAVRAIMSCCQAGTLDPVPLIDRLPGWPDNICQAGDGNFWLCLVLPDMPAVGAPGKGGPHAGPTGCAWHSFWAGGMRLHLLGAAARDPPFHKRRPHRLLLPPQRRHARSWGFPGCAA